MPNENHDEKLAAQIEIQENFAPYINARIVLDAIEKSEGYAENELQKQIRESAELQIKAAFAIEAGNTGLPDFVSMIVALARKK